jgi:hypothetical protein
MVSAKLRIVIPRFTAACITCIAVWWWPSMGCSAEQSDSSRSTPARPQPSDEDLRADYLSRCASGLTDEQIRSIIAEFQDAGLDFNWKDPHRTDEQLFALRASQHRWYLGLLKEGLSLTPEQSQEVTVKLTAVLSQGKAAFIKESKAPVLTDNPGDFAEILVAAREWLPNGDDPAQKRAILDLLPGRLCHLSPRQDQILKGDRLPNQPIPGGEIFPFSGIQKFLTADKMVFTNNPSVLQRQFLAQVRALHPSQFKTLLLLYPKTAAEIRGVLGES